MHVASLMNHVYLCLPHLRSLLCTCVVARWMWTIVVLRETSGGRGIRRAGTGSASRYMYMHMYMCTHVVKCPPVHMYMHVAHVCICTSVYNSSSIHLNICLTQCNTVNFSRRRFCMTCDCTRSGTCIHIMLHVCTARV